MHTQGITAQNWSAQALRATVLQLAERGRTRKRNLHKRKLSSPEIYLDLRRMILDSELLPGARVTESELAAHFSVSRTPIREALHRLEVEGFLEIRSKQGCFIRQVDIEEISNYYDVRVGLEAMAIELACAHMSDEAIKKLAEFWRPANRPRGVEALDEIKDAEEAFHVTLAESSGNEVLADYLRDVNDHIRVVRRLAFLDEQTLADTFREHSEICRMLLKRNVKAARAAMIDHIRKSQLTARNVTVAELQQQHKRQAKRISARRLAR